MIVKIHTSNFQFPSSRWSIFIHKNIGARAKRRPNLTVAQKKKHNKQHKREGDVRKKERSGEREREGEVRPQVTGWRRSKQDVLRYHSRLLLVDRRFIHEWMRCGEKSYVEGIMNAKSIVNCDEWCRNDRLWRWSLLMLLSSFTCTPARSSTLSFSNFCRLVNENRECFTKPSKKKNTKWDPRAKKKRSKLVFQHISTQPVRT